LIRVTSESGDPGTIGRLLLSLQRFLVSVDAELVLTGLEFGNSVTLRFEPVVPAGQREEIAELAVAHGDAPVPPQQMTLVIPESVVGLDLAEHLLAQEPEEVAAQARMLGTRARDSLRALTTAMAETSASLTFDPGLPARPGVPSTVVMEPERAARVADALRQAEQEPPRQIEIFGRLSLADSDSQSFGVVLRDADRP